MIFRASFIICVLAAIYLPVLAEEEAEDSNSLFYGIGVHGFYEIRAGYRTRNDPFEKDMSIMEQRFQLDISAKPDWGDWKIKGDTIGDLVEERGDFDLREAFVRTSPADFMDVKLGRQILTWGTGDLIFINDLFPKDFVSFFIGRDTDYLKAPSDAVKVSLFGESANLDIVYTPQFDSDRFIDGRRLSYFNSNLGRLAGQDAIIHTDKPDRWFRDDEIAARVYKNINNYEYALYAYHGFWKSPGGQNPAIGKAIFPDLSVYGASVQGNFAKGIGNLEFGYYQSEDDQAGQNGNVNNSELRFLAGYSQDIGRDFTVGLQYYIEHILDFEKHKESNPFGPDRDRDRHVVTVRLTKLLMNQNLRCSLFTFYSPSDNDVYMRPNVNYKVSDNLAVEAGANIFFGDHNNTFFGQFKNDSNIYTGIRYSF